MLLKGKRRLISSESGFTLIEMIVAFTLIAMIAVGLSSAFSVSVRSWARGTEFIDKTQRHRTILDKVRKQIASAYPLDVSMEATMDLPMESPGGVQAVAGRQIETEALLFNGAETSLSFISLNSLRFQESPGLTLVSYEIAQDSDGNYALVEREVPYKGQVFDQAAILNLSEATPIFENLSSCIFNYFDPGNNDNTSEWINEWNAQDRRQLPAAVSITMISQDREGNSLNRYMVIPVQAQVNDLRINPVNPLRGRIRTVVR